MVVTCYATPAKVKAARICEWFAEGVKAAGGSARVYPGIPDQLEAGAAVFYGVTPATAHLWRQAKAEGRDWYYIDNSYFDKTRGTHYRITRNAVQFKGIAQSRGSRRAALGIRVQPMRGGERVVVCLQSPEFMKTVAGITQPEWFDSLREQLKSHAGLPMVLRGWNGNKAQQMATLADDLKHAALLATWSSTAAVEALIAGVPVLCSEQCAAHGIKPEQRDCWVDSLADNQWTIDEIRDGTAWKALNA